jgi:predicted GNAT family N-acyltransferase
VPDVRRITTDDPLYAQECDLRERVLLGPIGLDMPKFRAMFPGVEERFEHFVAVTKSRSPVGERVIGCATLLPYIADRSKAVAATPDEIASLQAAHARGGTGEQTPMLWGKLMQMAVDPQRQGEGIGTRLVVAIERRAFAELGLTELYCHARDTAYGFYSSLGWDFSSEVFDEAGVPHRKMAFLAPSRAGSAAVEADPLISGEDDFA